MVQKHPLLRSLGRHSFLWEVLTSNKLSSILGPFLFWVEICYHYKTQDRNSTIIFPLTFFTSHYLAFGNRRRNSPLLGVAKGVVVVVVVAVAVGSVVAAVPAPAVVPCPR